MSVRANILRLCEALESGVYHQTQSRLRNKEAFCCLGVACDIYDSSKWLGNIYSFDNGGYVEHKEFYPPNCVDAFFGFNISTTNRQDYYTIGAWLGGMNDSNKSFKEIAQWLRDHIEEFPED